VALLLAVVPEFPPEEDEPAPAPLSEVLLPVTGFPLPLSEVLPSPDVPLAEVDPEFPFPDVDVVPEAAVDLEVVDVPELAVVVPDLDVVVPELAVAVVVVTSGVALHPDPPTSPSPNVAFDGHAQLKLPGVFTQVAIATHTPERHSLMSTQFCPFTPEYPSSQTHTADRSVSWHCALAAHASPGVRHSLANTGPVMEVGAEGSNHP